VISETFVEKTHEEKINIIQTSVIDWIENPFLKELTDRFLRTYSEIFFKAPAAGRHHHAYEGGLLDHSYEVMQIASVVSELYPQINRDLIYCGGFLHDIGKMKNYSPYILKSGKISTATPYKRNDYSKIMDHFGEGHRIITEMVKDMEYEGYTIEPIPLFDIHHIIASHHGPVALRWGSEVDPNTPEAWIICQADMISSRVGGDDPNNSPKV
jgi:3'-5' exoribonuclease